MTIAERMLPGLDHEMALTRKVLALVREEHAGLRPHPRSWTLGELLAHVARGPGWIERTLTSAEFDVDPPGQSLPPRGMFESVPAALKLFDDGWGAGRALLASASDETMNATWTLRKAGQVVFTLPRRQVLNAFILHHMIHHRGQMTVYLCIADVPLPAIYGPSADSGPLAER